MPTFFSKVFSRGKDKDRERGKDGGKEPASPTTKQGKRASIHSLLEGKFEAVSPAISPSASKTGETDREKEAEKAKEKEKPALFRPLSRTKATATSSRKPEDVPHLTLNLNLPSLKDDTKKNGDLDVVYESVAVLSDTELGEKRLNASEALKLMLACSSVISSRGLETLGIMHPHWHSSSPAVQRKIISLYLGSLLSGSAVSSNSVASAFEYELEYARDPHDVAAVFRWALRHLKLDGNSFGKDGNGTLGWYDSFAGEEKVKQYPPKAYSDILLPAIKPSHVDVLNATLNLFSSLASHSEMNGVSGSRLSMSLGYYLLTGNNVTDLGDWPAFYANWERAGRALEHIFLANLRDEDTKSKVPKRLAELISKYPYSVTDDRFPRPAAFATRAYDALYVRITSEVPIGVKPSSEQRLPLKVVVNALKSETGGASDETEVIARWEELKRIGTTPSEQTSLIDQPEAQAILSRILSDETISLLSLKADRTDKISPTVTAFAVGPDRASQSAKPSVKLNGKTKPTNGSATVSRNVSEATSEQSPIASDWNFFSSAGFGEASTGQSLAATLLDTDIEKTQPPPVTRRRSQKKRGRSPGASKPSSSETPTPSTSVAAPEIFKSTLISVVKVDESFIDFWNDALIDPISDSWPSFVVCQLNPSLALSLGENKITWLVIEQKYVTAPPPPVEEPPSPVRRASSPKPSIRSEADGRPSMAGRVSSTFSATRRRFNFFGGGTSNDKATTISPSESREAKRPEKGVKVGEMGEIIREEEPSPTSPMKDEATSKVEQAGDANGKNATAVVAGAAIASTGAVISATAEKAPEASNAAGKPAEATEPSVQKEAVEAESVIEDTAGVKGDVEAKENGVDPVAVLEEEAIVPAAGHEVSSAATETKGDSTIPIVATAEEGEAYPPVEKLVSTEDVPNSEEANLLSVDEAASPARGVQDASIEPPNSRDALNIPEVIEAPAVVSAENSEVPVIPASEEAESVPEPAKDSQVDEHEQAPIDISEAKAKVQSEAAADSPLTEDSPAIEEGVKSEAPEAIVEEPSAVPSVEDATTPAPIAPLGTQGEEPESHPEAKEETKSEGPAELSQDIAEEPKLSDSVEIPAESVDRAHHEPVPPPVTAEPIAEADDVQKLGETQETPAVTSGPVATDEVEPHIEPVHEEDVADATPHVPSEPEKELSSNEEPQTEVDVVNHRPGADGSRFVEQLHTPPEPIPAALESSLDAAPSDIDVHEQGATGAEDNGTESEILTHADEPKAATSEETTASMSESVQEHLEPEDSVRGQVTSLDEVQATEEPVETIDHAEPAAAAKEPVLVSEAPVSDPEKTQPVTAQTSTPEVLQPEPTAADNVPEPSAPALEAQPDASGSTEEKYTAEPTEEAKPEEDKPAAEPVITETISVTDEELKPDQAEDGTTTEENAS